ncbi:DUF1033 family protein [Viridibacillus sp. YIM B01967]|uniref:DUF1033 family protein n=1 Tax=Viridibacillus soli TaxID=2798301 RepID=A0ABS1H3B1_9BACL|nr:DUF1033 family protein [Viridibacillus soli]MBK3493888.1 DUF1033 family protein [Viridibacillus soli]
MYKIIYMKADYEPWWQFEGWEECIVEENTFQVKEEAERYLVETLQDFKEKYEHDANKKEHFWAFWSDDEIGFCEACDEDIQTYHGIIWVSE